MNKCRNQVPRPSSPSKCNNRHGPMLCPTLWNSQFPTRRTWRCKSIVGQRWLHVRRSKCLFVCKRPLKRQRSGFARPSFQLGSWSIVWRRRPRDADGLPFRGNTRRSMGTWLQREMLHYGHRFTPAIICRSVSAWQPVGGTDHRWHVSLWLDSTRLRNRCASGGT